MEDLEPNNSNEKKITFEDLNREELIRKCKTFVAIVQKAKQSKIILQEEINQLKAKIESSMMRELPSAVDEMIQNLTVQKLDLVSKLEDLKMQNDALVTNLNQYKEEKNRLEVKLNRIDSENVAYKRQISRLEEDNEQLMTHLASLEGQIEELNTIGKEQQKQLLKLEDQHISLQNNSKQKIGELEKMLSISLEEIKLMKNEPKMGGTENVILTTVDPNVNKLLENRNEKLIDKLKNYHLKIVRLAVSVKQLKQDKNIILNEFKMYIDEVNNWKSKLCIASEKLKIVMTNSKQEHKELKQHNEHLKNVNAQMMDQLETRKTDDEKSKELVEISTLKLDNINLSDNLEISNNYLNIVSLEKEKLQDENHQLKAEIGQKHNSELETQQMCSGKQRTSINNSEVENHFQESIIEGNEENSLLHKEILIMKNEISMHISEKTELNEEISRLQQMKNDQELCVLRLEEKVKNLNDELNKSLATEKQLAEKSGEELLNLVQEIETLTQNSMKLQERIEEMEQREERKKGKLVNADIQTENDFVPTEEQVLLLKNENSQLLVEMNEMNQELKERGENLSKLEAHCEEIRKKIQIYETQANKNVNNISEKEETIRELEAQINVLKMLNSNVSITEKDEEIATLRSEIDLLKDRLTTNNVNYNYAESDIMSTSTISRAEELDRLKDLEGSWEEKYGKLRSLAIKLKAKLREQIAEFSKERAEKIETEQKLNDNMDSLKTLQSQYEHLKQELEVNTKECEESADKKGTQPVIAMLKEHISKMQTEIDDFKKEKTNTEIWKKQIGVKVQALRKELEDKEAAKKDYDLKFSKLNADLQAMEESLKLEVEKHRQTKNSLQQSTNENKKNTVLNLEMQDYEKSVKELSQKLEKKIDQITMLKGQVDSQKGIITVLRDQNGVLEEKIRSHECDLESALHQSTVYKKNTLELGNTLQIKEEELSTFQQQVEALRSENEELSAELSKEIADRQKIINNLREEKEVLYLHNVNLQQSNRDQKQMLSLKETELLTIGNEYENYKIRAQSVFRQNQGRDFGLEEKLSGNVSSLMSQVETLKSDLEAMRKLNETLHKDNETFQIDQRLMSSKYEEISNEMNESRYQYDQLLAKYNQALNEHNETVRSLKVHAETLGQCYRQQLTDQEVRHNREIVELQSKMEKGPCPAEVVLPTSPTMPREEGEGSESTESVSNIPIPLEKLLGDGDDQIISILKKQINEQELKLTHLTDLLADTEQDLAKHVQMNKVLKEEIRRQQRVVEREKHGENLEYLKNVVFKFVTLNSGDERGRLVPVLNTILKLSPEETEKLHLVARGDPSLKAWSSYLPMWSSSNKP